MADGTDDVDDSPQEFGSELLTSRSDRMIIYAMAALIVLMGIFVVYTGIQLKNVDEERQQLLVAVQQQDQHLVCFAEASTAFQVVLADDVQSESLSPLLQAQIESAKQYLKDTRAACFGAGEPTMSGSTTTTR